MAEWAPRDIAAAGAGGGLDFADIAEIHKNSSSAAFSLVYHNLVLAETMDGAENFTLISGDVLKLDLPELVDRDGRSNLRRRQKALRRHIEEDFRLGIELHINRQRAVGTFRNWWIGSFKG